MSVKCYSTQLWMPEHILTDENTSKIFSNGKYIFDGLMFEGTFINDVTQPRVGDQDLRDNII